MSTLIYYAIPFFVLTILFEAALTARRNVLGFEWRDTWASLAMGLGNVTIAALTKGWMLAFWLLLEPYAIFDIGTQWWAWVLVILGDDFCYYWFHRAHHEVRLFWAAHVNHHSSRRYNLSTALRQSWTTPFTGPIFWVPLVILGFDPWMIVTAQAISLLYQYWIHTELIDRMGWFERLFNTPSHHRVHHGRNVHYLDRNYGGILIVWDRLFGTFEPEMEPLDYGLTHNIDSYNPVVIAFHEWVAMLKDVAREDSWRGRLGLILHPPGWKPDGGITAANLRSQAGL